MRIFHPLRGAQKLLKQGSRPWPQGWTVKIIDAFAVARCGLGDCATAQIIEC
jgi:hypothetical protein